MLPRQPVGGQAHELSEPLMASAQRSRELAHGLATARGPAHGQRRTYQPSSIPVRKRSRSHDDEMLMSSGPAPLGAGLYMYGPNRTDGDRARRDLYGVAFTLRMESYVQLQSFGSVEE